MAMVECKECSALVDSVEATPNQLHEWICNYNCNGDEKYG